MWLVLAALRRPITVLVAVLAILLSSTLAVRRMQADIFPNLGAPVIADHAPARPAGWLRAPDPDTARWRGLPVRVALRSPRSREGLA